MDLSQLPAPAVFTVAALETVATLLGCYALAVAYGHVHPWLPMISDCGVHSPEKYPFRLGVVLGCSLMAGGMALVYAAGKPYSKSSASLALSTVASFSLAVSAVVSEKEDSAVHGAAAAIFFVMYEVNMVALAWVLPQEESDRRSPVFWTQLLRKLCSIANGLGILAFAFMSTDRNRYRLYIAVVEWSGTLLCLAFNWSFAVDLCSICVDVNERTTRKEKHEYC